MHYQFRPIEQWPGPRTRDRQRSRFKASYQDTLRLLERELVHLQATNIVVQADCDESMIRRDGMLRSNAVLRGPGVILSFDSKHGPLSYPCDTYANWDCNLRAIALSLEALRTVDRYGVTKRAEQYQGWAKLPGPKPESPASAATAVSVLAEAARCNDSDVRKDRLEEIYRAACRRTHPDIGGDPEAFKRVQAAKDVLDRYWGSAA
jgi:hypothetical protein